MLNKILITFIFIGVGYRNTDFKIPIKITEKEKNKSLMKNYQKILDIGNLIYIKNNEMFKYSKITEEDFKGHINCGIKNTMSLMSNKTEKNKFIKDIIIGGEESLTIRKMFYREIALCSNQIMSQEKKDLLIEYKKNLR